MALPIKTFYEVIMEIKIRTFYSWPAPVMFSWLFTATLFITFVFAIPPGIQNYGNTCFLNSAIQILRSFPSVRFQLLDSAVQVRVLEYLKNHKFEYEESKQTVAHQNEIEQPLKELLNNQKATHPIALQRDLEISNGNKTEEEIKKIIRNAEEILENDPELNEYRNALKEGALLREISLQKIDIYRQHEVLKYLMQIFLILESHDNARNSVELSAQFYQLEDESSPDASLVDAKENLNRSLPGVISSLRVCFSTSDRMAAHTQASASEFFLFAISAMRTVTDLFKSHQVLRPFLTTEDANVSLEEILVRDDKLEDIKQAIPEVLLIDINHISLDDRKVSCSFSYKTVLRMNDVVYHLIAVIIHQGSKIGGHYYSYAKTEDPVRPWILFNDTIVDQVIEKKLFNEESKAHFFVFAREDKVGLLSPVSHWSALVTDEEYLFHTRDLLISEVESAKTDATLLEINRRCQVMKENEPQIQQLEKDFLDKLATSSQNNLFGLDLYSFISNLGPSGDNPFSLLHNSGKKQKKKKKKKPVVSSEIDFSIVEEIDEFQGGFADFPDSVGASIDLDGVRSSQIGIGRPRSRQDFEKEHGYNGDDENVAKRKPQ